MNREATKNYLVRFLIIFGAIMIFVLAACSGSDSASDTSDASDSSSNEKDNQGGDIKIAIIGSVQALAPASELRPMQDLFITGTALEKLGKYNEEGKMDAELAESWEEDPEELLVRYKLKEGITFHDGTDFNAEAVKWNIEEYLDSGRPELNGIESIEVIDDFTVEIQLAEWNSSMLYNINYFVPMTSPTAYEENGKEWVLENPIGTGPYKFVEHNKDESVLFEKNDEYWQEGKPHLDTVEFSLFADPTTAEATLQAGEVDVYVISSALVANNIKDNDEFVVLENSTGLGALGIGVVGDSANPDSPFADERVRKAMSLAIDRDAIVDSLFYGFAFPTNQWGVQDSPISNDTIDIGYDPDRAKELLKEAGYPDGFKTTYNVVNNPVYTQLGTAVQDFLSEIGIEAELNVMDSALFRQVTTAANNESWDGLMQYNGRGDHDLATYMPRNFTTEGPLYANNIDQKEDIHKLLDELKSEVDETAVKEKSMELQRLLVEEHALASFIYVDATPAVLNGIVKNSGINTGHAAEWTPAEIFIDK